VTLLRHCEPAGGAPRRTMCEAIQRPGAPVKQGWIASSQGLLAMTAVAWRQPFHNKMIDWLAFADSLSFRLEFRSGKSWEASFSST
jgi:hypothetical protein